MAKRVPIRTSQDTSSGSQPVIISTGSTNITLPTPDARHVNLMQSAMQWTYVVRSRQRWSAAPASIRRQAAAAERFLSECGLGTRKLEEIALGELVEVSTDWSGAEAKGWAARILPWEYVIAGATHALRNDRPLTVTRHLNRIGEKPPVDSAIKKVLFVASEPGALQGRYEFRTERESVKVSFEGREWRELNSPTAEQLRDEIRSFKPCIVHLAGFDTHQAANLLGDEQVKRSSLKEIDDGYVLSGRTGPDFVNAEELGKILSSGGHHPKLVSLNVGNSAARIAPLIVAKGASAAIGFQDNFNDELAELFFSVLYSRLGRLDEKLHDGFRHAWERVRNEPAHRQGTGVVLWSAISAFLPPVEKKISKQDPQAKRREQHQITQEQTYVDAAKINPVEVEKWISVDVEPFGDLNYSMLHNQAPMFKKFVLHARTPQPIRNVEVRVSLSTGPDSAVFQRTLDIIPPSFNLNPFIHVPLTSAITRSVHESVRTSLLVEVVWGGHVVYRDTKRVRLTPVDQWRDSDTDRKWLPSFVFPRDVAVMRLIDTAQQYVRVLRDDPAAGFDGYQGFDPKHPETSSEVDLQVQAIWATIIHEWRLGYINPPPGYSNELDAQRLRTPTMIARDHSGTCIDLALFFAACLELIDVYPVIFLLSGHAFPGYWRDSSYHAEFVEARPEEIQDIVRADYRTSAIYGAQSEPWFLGKPTYREIVQLVNTGKLVPIETVRLTEHSGFHEAVGAGRDNLRVRREFEAMVDIALAREKQVTPLPILGEQ